MHNAGNVYDTGTRILLRRFGTPQNVLNTMMSSLFFIMGVASVLWVLVGYSLSFSGDIGSVIGNLDWLGLNGVGWEAGPYSDTIPHLAFAAFQMMFAIITPALITGALAGRMKFKSTFSSSLFSGLFLVYYPMAHMVLGRWVLGRYRLC